MAFNLENMLSRILGTQVFKGDSTGSINYTKGGLFGKDLLTPTEGYVKNYQVPGASSGYISPLSSPQQTQDEYVGNNLNTALAQEPTSTPTPTPMVDNLVPEPDKDIYEFPVNDKPAIPEEYRTTVAQAPNSSIVASVMAQESGGYEYLPAVHEPYEVFNPEKGKMETKWRLKKILPSWEEAKKQKLVGPSGEVGITQIIPKYYWEEAGFSSEEEYADALYDPYFAIQEAGRILNDRFQKTGDWVKALNQWNVAPNFPKEILGRIGIQL
jgi:hypothetical protein